MKYKLTHDDRSAWNVALMTGTAPFLAVVLLALLVGAAMPVLYQLYRLLKRARIVLDTTGPRLERALDQAGQATERLNGISSGIEAQVQALGPLFETAAVSARWLGSAMSFGGAFGPAVMAGARALFSKAEARPRTVDSRGHTTDKENHPDTQTPRETRQGGTP